MSYGMVIGSAVGTVSGIMQQKAQNDAIEAQAEYNNKMLEMNDNLASFTQSINLNRANETVLAYFSDISKQKSELKVQANQQISKVQNKQLSGITAGKSKERQIQTAYREVGKELGKIEQQGELVVNQVLEKARADNEQLQINKINNYNQTLMKNAQLAGQAITGANAALLVADSSLKYGNMGYSLGEKFNSTKTTKETEQFSDNSMFYGKEGVYDDFNNVTSQSSENRIGNLFSIN